MTNLPAPSANSAKSLSLAISPVLRSLLRDAPSVEQAAETIGRSPALRAEAVEALPVLKAIASRPATDEEIRDIIGRRFSVFRQPEMSEHEAAAWWEVYFDALDDLPAGSIEAGLRAWGKLRDSEFMPKPGRLRELALTAPNDDVRAYSIARMGVEFQVPPEPGDPANPPGLRRFPIEPSAADKERVRQMARQFAANAQERPAASNIRPNHGETDERGLTPEMRDLMARRAS